MPRRIARIAALLSLCASPLTATEVGRIGVDWIGNDILIEALPDPKV